ncbi:uncharacterized protein LOC135683691 [Rhopilema esculentum]|uniref:uncharacterized protein LOC135683691 n=1 Tax=Rhopilema esculentum TaxID=499914 RepID=UPI0031D6A4F3
MRAVGAELMMSRLDQYEFMKKSFINKEAIRKGNYVEAWDCFRFQLNVVLREKNPSPGEELQKETIHYLKLMLDTAEQKENKILKSYTLNFLGRQYNLAEQFQEALLCFQQNIPLSSKVKNPDLQGRAFIGCGYAYFHLKHYALASESYKSAIKNAESTYNSSRLLIATTFLGRCYLEMEKWDEAVGFFKRAMEKGGEKGDLSKDLLCYILSGFGKIYAQNGRYEEAVAHLEPAVNLASRLRFDREQADLLLCLSNATFNMGLHDKALAHVNVAIQIGKTLKDDAFVKEAEIFKEDINRQPKNEENTETEAKEQDKNRKEEDYKPGNEVIEALVCPICLEIAEKAVETSCCHNVYCEKCLSMVINGPCPQCRNEFQILASHVCRRMIGNLPAVCSFIGCTAKLTRSELNDHEQRCEHRLYKCPAPKCLFEGLKENYLLHLIQEHKEDVVKRSANLFSMEQTSEQTNNRIRAKVNEAGRECRLGSTGKYYCGFAVGPLRCDCCDIYCGPENGCNCAACMKLDIKSFKLAKGWYVNRDGCVCQQNTENGNVYCGRLAITPSEDSDGFCGPDVGSNCDACRILQNQLRDRYAYIWE